MEPRPDDGDDEDASWRKVNEDLPQWSPALTTGTTVPRGGKILRPSGRNGAPP